MQINRENRTTILISSHILSEMAKIADRIGVIDKGIILEEISMTEIVDKGIELESYYLELLKEEMLYEAFNKIRVGTISPKTTFAGSHISKHYHFSFECFCILHICHYIDAIYTKWITPLQLSTVAIAKLLIKTTLIVWQSVLIATIIVEEYESKTIMLLYTYPINRKKMIAAKITLVCGIMLIFYLNSEVFQHIAIYIFSRYISFITYQLDNILIQLVIIVSAILLGLVPLYIGMIRKSTIATIVSSLIIVCITSNSQEALRVNFCSSSGNNVWRHWANFAALAIKKITTSDLY